MRATFSILVSIFTSQAVAFHLLSTQEIVSYLNIDNSGQEERMSLLFFIELFIYNELSILTIVILLRIKC